MEFVDSRSMRNQAKILSFFSLLGQHGPILPRPLADLLEDGIHELRIKLSGDQIRILYFFFFKDYIVLTHSFTKKTGKVPKAEIKKAKKLRKDFLQRYDLEKLKEAIDESI